jgi:hypothetical protein
LLHAWEVALVGADTAQDVRPPVFPDVPSPVHAVGLVAMGMPLLDNADVEELAAHCAEQQQWEFLFMVAALPIAGATSSAVNPLAVF